MATKATRTELVQAVIVTAEVIGHEISPIAAEAMARELAEYPAERVAGALRRCQRELHGRLTLAAILQRIDDGHLGAEEAWALCPRSEADTVVWTDEISTAFESARPLLAEGDQIAARMAFRDAYGRALSSARDERGEAVWWVSLGHDSGGRVTPLRRAVELGRLSAGEAASHVNPELPGYEALAALAAPDEAKALPADTEIDRKAVDMIVSDVCKRLRGPE